MQTLVPILMYHAIAEVACAREAPYTTPPAAFAAQMRRLRDAGYSTLSQGELIALWDRGESPPERSVIITFDDGFACLHDTALPIMQTFGIRASAYPISGYLDRMARYDADLGIPARPMLARTQVRELHAAGIEIGSHSVNHPDLRSLSTAGLRYELERSRGDLEDLIGAPVMGFSYPRGLFNRNVHDRVGQAGYRWSCSTRPGLNEGHTDRFALRRVEIGSRTGERDFDQMLRKGAPASRLIRDRWREKIIFLIATLQGRDPMDLYLQPLRRPFSGARSPAALRADEGA